jgi:hypothetical protein
LTKKAWAYKVLQITIAAILALPFPLSAAESGAAVNLHKRSAAIGLALFLSNEQGGANADPLREKLLEKFSHSRQDLKQAPALRPSEVFRRESARLSLRGKVKDENLDDALNPGWQKAVKQDRLDRIEKSRSDNKPVDKKDFRDSKDKSEKGHQIAKNILRRMEKSNVQQNLQERASRDHAKKLRKVHRQIEVGGGGNGNNGNGNAGNDNGNAGNAGNNGNAGNAGDNGNAGNNGNGNGRGR